MRVTHVITRLIVGGAQENTLATVLGLRRRPDIDVRLLSGPTVGAEGSLEPEAAAISGLLQVLPHLVRPIHPWHDVLATRHLCREFRRNLPDIVHTHSGKAGLLGRCAARRAKVPIIVHTIHGPSFGEFQSSAANLAFRTAERIAGAFTTHFVSVAQAMTDQYLKAGIGRPEQFSRIFSGFPLAPFLEARNSITLRERLGIGPGHFVIGKIGRLFKLKGHQELIDLAPQLVATIPSIRFLLVGEGPWRQRFQKQVNGLGLNKHFVFTGLVAPAEVPAYIGIMDTLVHLSRREGLARALPQALAAGVPIVAFDIDGAREVCVDNETGFLIQPEDPGGVVRRIKQMADSPQLRSRLGRTGQERVVRLFDVETMVEQIEQLYRRLKVPAAR